MMANDPFFMEYIDFLDVKKQISSLVGPSVAVYLICIEVGEDQGDDYRLLHVSRDMRKLVVFF